MPIDINDWDTTAGNNNQTPPDGWPENTMQYSEVNNTGREGMAVNARFYKDINGSLNSAGVADAYTVTLNQNNYSAYFTGLYFACRILATNTGPSTIDVTSSAALGVQNIVDRDGNALPPNALRANTIYEFRYDGVNFQVQGPLAGSVVVDSATISGTTPIDLVDTDNPFNIGAEDPDTNPHVAYDLNSVQAKSNATTATEFSINQLGGSVDIGPQSGTGTVRLFDGSFIAGQTGSTGLSSAGSSTGAASAGASSTAAVALFNRDQIGTFADRHGHIGFNSDVVLQIKNFVHNTGQIELMAEDGAGADSQLALFGVNTGAQLNHTGDAKIQTIVDGMNLIGSSANSPSAGTAQDTNIIFQSAGGAADAARFGFLNNADFRIDSNVHGGGFQVTGENSSGTARTIIDASPDSSVDLYQENRIKIRTQLNGGAFRGSVSDNPTTGLAQDTNLELLTDGGSSAGVIGFNATPAISISNFVHGGGFIVTAEDAGGTQRTLISSDPDTNTQLFNAGTATARTTTTGGGGLEVDAGAGFVRVLNTADLSSVGDVVGPGSATDHAAARFDLTTGKLIQDSGLIINDDGTLESTCLFTGGNGIQVLDQSGTTPEIRFLSDAFALRGVVGATGINFQAYNNVNSGEFTFLARNAGGTLLEFMNADPDTDVRVRHPASDDISWETTTAAAGGLLVNNTLTALGLERVATVTDITDSGLGGSLAATSGYFELGPFLIQWGITGLIADTAAVATNFPTTFNTVYQAVATCNAGGGDHFVQITALSTTQITLQQFDTAAGNTCTCRFIAIGTH